MMLEVIKSRRSVRQYSSRAISRQDILEIVEAGVYAPSGSNWQTSRFLIIDDTDKIKRFWQIKAPKGRFDTAPLMIVVFSDNRRQVQGPEQELWSKLRIQDSAAAMQNMLLMATAKGIASCWVSLWKEMEGTRLLTGHMLCDIFDKNILEYHEPQCMGTFGYPLRVEDLGGEEEHGVCHARVSRHPTEHYLL